MNCKEFEESIWGYLLGDMPDTEKFNANNHIDSCNRCKAELEERRKFKVVVEEAMIGSKLQLRGEEFNEILSRKLSSRMNKYFWIQRIKQIKLKHVAIAVIFICTSAVAASFKTTATEKWLAEENHIISKLDNPTYSETSDNTEISRIIKRATVLAPKHIDLGDSKEIIEKIKDKNQYWQSDINSDGTSILLTSEDYVLNYKIGQGYDMAIDLSKSGVGDIGINKSKATVNDNGQISFQRLYSPNKNYIMEINKDKNKIYMVDVKRSSLTEINMKLEEYCYIAWSDNEKYFVVNNYSDSQTNAFGGKIDDNGKVIIVSFIGGGGAGQISDEGYYAALDNSLTKIDSTDKIESKDIKVIGDEELNTYGFNYCFSNDKTIALAEKYNGSRKSIYLCELKGKEATVIKRIDGEYTFVSYDGDRIGYFNNDEMVSVNLKDLSVTKEKGNFDSKNREKEGILSPNYFSYIDYKGRNEKTLIRKSADDSVLISIDLPLTQLGFKYLNGDELLIVDSHLSLKDMKILKVNVKTKKIEDIK